ncbi:MAG: sigma-70 family RNA polymerase sigma factor [Gemmatimonadota bacterium]
MPNAHQRLDDGTLNLLRSGLRIVALRSLDDPEAAEEAVQEALVRGLVAMEEGRLNNPEALGAYFRGIIRHVIADTLRRRRRTISLELLADLPDENPSSNALHRLVSEEQTAAVAGVMAKLSPQARECLHLIYFQGLHPREVAARLGEPSSRIRKRRSRALQRIRAILLDGKGAGGGHETGPWITILTREWATEGPNGPGDGDEG